MRDSHQRRRIAQAQSAATLLATSGVGGKGREKARRQKLEPFSRKTPLYLRRRGEECHREKALAAAYKAATELLGPTESKELHMPNKEKEEEEEEEERSELEEMKAREMELMQQVEVLRNKITQSQRNHKLTIEQKSRYIKEQDRVLFNVRCGFELMTEMAATASASSSRMSIRDKSEMRSRPRTPPFIRLINDSRATFIDRPLPLPSANIVSKIQHNQEENERNDDRPETD